MNSQWESVEKSRINTVQSVSAASQFRFLITFMFTFTRFHPFLLLDHSHPPTPNSTLSIRSSKTTTNNNNTAFRGCRVGLP